MFGYLYKIENKFNNKIYIGKTYKNIYERFKEHLYNALVKKEDTKLYNDIRKYGQHNFEINILGKFEETELEYKEIEYIKKYDSWKNGYNQSVGGEGYYRNIDRDQLIISDFENSNNIDKISKKYNLSKKEITKILYKNNVKKYLDSQKPIAMFDINGDFVQKFCCILELIEITGFEEKEIKKCLNDSYRQYKGHYFSHQIPF